MTDPIADLLTRIRNAYKAGLATTLVPASQMKRAMLGIMKDHGFIESFEDVKDPQGHEQLKVVLLSNLNHVIGFRRVSKPGQRIYVDRRHLPKVMNGLGIAILSTSQGVMTNRNAKKQGLGGEILCEIW